MDRGCSIIVGGTGFIGSHLAAHLLKTQPDHDIVSFDIVGPTNPVEGVSYRTVDVRQPIPDDLFAGPVETIYNFAAVHQTPGHADDEYYETNVNDAVHVCRFASRHDAKHIVFLSSISVYGSTEEPVTEDSEPRPDTAYGRSKLIAERIHSFWCEQNTDRRLRIVRAGVIFGPGGGGNFVRLADALRKRTFVYPGRKDTIKACGYVEDLVGSIAFSLGIEDRQFVYNFCYPNRHSIEDICASFQRVAGYAPPWGNVPSRLILPVAGMLEKLGLITGHSKINRARILKLLRSTNVEPKNIIDAGFEGFTPLDDALRRWMTINECGQVEFK